MRARRRVNITRAIGACATVAAAFGAGVVAIFGHWGLTALFTAQGAAIGWGITARAEDRSRGARRRRRRY